ncbi:MAG: PAS domain-containing hybrid sensor histidine kinase/response regulator, partial [Proteobacteria bacterium]
FTEVLGYTEEELTSRPCTDFIHPDDIDKTIEQILIQKEGQSVFSFENRYRTKNGDYRLLSWKSSPSENGITYGVARDITDERARQQKIATLKEDAVAASKAKSEFLATMSHEIRTPINGVVGMTSLLLDTALSADQLDYAKNIKSSADALLAVVNDILDFSKVEAGKIDLEKVDFDLVSLIDETAKSVSFLLKNKSIPLLVNVKPEARRHFNGDPGRIRQILTNLLSNAEKFTEHGTVKLEARVDYSTDKLSVLRFSVIDTGIGLSASQASKIFQGFSQADGSNARKFGGMGLGLSISKRLVELMKGRIEVESEQGVGSTFWFTIPLEHSTFAAAANPTQDEVIKTKYPNAQLLVAEDNFVNQQIILAMLGKLGFAAQSVANGQEVLAILKERHFDLILMDCQMPEMDGYEATKRIRSAFEKDY